jgi:coronin-1B/1C/6
LHPGSDNKIFIWNVGTGEALVEIDAFPDIPLSACWNSDGSKIVTSCKDKKIRVFDPRTGEVLVVSVG